MVDIEEEKYFVSAGMIRFGGSFVSNLGEALSRADTENTRRIKKAFPEYWDIYLKQGKEAMK
jgi:hypothetical protein